MPKRKPPLRAEPQTFPPPPRTVRRHSGWPRIILLRYVFTAAITLILLGLVALGLLSVYGTPTQGQLTGIREKRFSNGTPSYFLQYSFDIDGKHYEREQRIFGRERISALALNSSVTVRSVNIFGYRYATIADSFNAFIELNAAIIGTAALLALLYWPVAIMRGWIHPNRQQRLLRHGMIVTGEITDFPPGPRQQCVYRYTDTAGQTHAGRAHISPMRAMQLQVGDPITIAYDPAKPNKHLFYDICDFRIENTST